MAKGAECRRGFPSEVLTLEFALGSLPLIGSSVLFFGAGTRRVAPAVALCSRLPMAPLNGAHLFVRGLAPVRRSSHTVLILNCPLYFSRSLGV